MGTSSGWALKEQPMLRMTFAAAKSNGASSVTDFVAAYRLDDTGLRLFSRAL
jgi:hypothetical protein